MGRLVVFVALTYLVSWAAWFGAGALAPGATDPHGFVWSTLIYIGTFAPSLVAIALTAHEKGTAGLSALFARLVKGEVRPRWFLFAFFYMFAIKLVVAAIYRATHDTWPAFGDEPIYLLIVATIFSTMIFVQAGEELGWRGYLLPRLATRLGYAWSSIVVGVVWASWHLPLFYIAGADKTGQSFPIWALSVTAVSVAIAWLYVNTGGSLLLTMLMHAAVNNMGAIVPSATLGATNVWAFTGSTTMMLTLVVLWVPAVWFLVKMARVPKPEDST